MGRINFGHYLLGLEGVALLRSWLVGPREQADARTAEMARILAAPGEPPLSMELDVADEEVVGGYARWADTYDTIPNPLILAEEPVVRRLIGVLPPGIALDAACGTGRHAAYLAAHGHTVVGVDASPAMLAKAQAALPQATFHVGDLDALPLPDASVDLALCALALTHVAGLDRPVAELARVLRPGGRLIASDLHPFVTLLGASAFFAGGDGRAGNVRSYVHLHGSYLRAFRAAGLVVEACHEPAGGEEEIALMAAGLFDLAPEGFRAALGGVPIAVVWQATRPE